MSIVYKYILALLFDKYRSRAMKQKINKIHESIPIVDIPPGLKKQHIELWNALGKKMYLKWLEVYCSISHIIDYRYVSEIDYYLQLEPRLNNRTFSEAYCDKNFYHRYIDKNLLPRVFLRNIEGVYYTENYETIKQDEYVLYQIPPKTEKIIVKIALDSGGGRDVCLYQKEGEAWRALGGERLTDKLLQDKFKRNFIIQEYIKQHPFYSQFNPTSVNTIRVLTYRSVKTNEVIPLQCVLRIGKTGSIVDNQASGGLACGIRVDGSLNNFAVNKKGEKFECYNGIHFSEIGKIYKYEEITDLAIEIAQKFPYHRLLGFDFCVDSANKIKLIEINNRNNEINFYQMSNGPLFRQYTEEVIRFCTKQKRSVCFDFEM